MDESSARSRHPDGMRQAILSGLLPVLVFVLNVADPTYAQVATHITPSDLPACPGPCGAGVTIVTPLPPAQGGTITITGGARPGDGLNLFHSFGQFNVGTGDVANFLNDSHLPTLNILSRVTGGNPSQIYGTIRTTDFPGTNLFLMNPAGVLFGATGVLDLGTVSGSAVRQPGSFYATTADYLNLGDADGTSPFYADALQTSVLSVAPVVAFGFLGPNAASIAIQGGNLEVPDGQTLSFIGGPGVFTPDTGVPVPSGVTMTAGRLSAPNGLIYMETVTAPGEIPLPTLSGSPLGSPVSFPGSENAVIYVQSGELVMKGASLLTATTGPTSGEPIDIVVELAGQFTMQNRSTLSSSTTGEGQAGAINVSASTLVMDASSITTETSGDGNAGHITANVGTLSLANGATINSNNFSFGIGQSGNLTIQGRTGAGSAADSVTLNGSTITTQTFGPGKGGDILITSGAVQLDTGAGINSFTFSDFEAGAGGDIFLNVGTLTLRDFALIQSLTQTFSSAFGQGGDVTIQGLPGAIAAESVVLSSGSSLSSQTFANGDGGRVAVTAKSVVMDGSAQIIASSIGEGRGGDILLHVQNASLSGGSSLTSLTDFFSLGAGAGGSTTVEGLEPGSKADFLTLAQGSGIISRANGEGRLGDVVVLAKTVTLTDGAVIKVGDQNDPGTAGNVTIDADSVGISGGSTISSQAFAQDAGQVVITADALTMDNGSIVTQTHGLGRGGDVVLNVESVSLANGATINSSSSSTEAGAGAAGNVTIQGLASPANSVTITDSSVTTTTEGPGEGGTITMEAVAINLSNGRISASTSGTGNAGGITANVATLTLTNAAEISSSSTGAATGAAGSVTIQGLASPANSVTLTNSSLRTSADSTGRGGSITVDATNVTLNGATISASVKDVNAADGTDGPTSGLGNIALISSTMNMTGGTVTAATSGARNAGQVIITAPALSLNDGTITTSTSSSGDAGGITAIVGTMNLTNGSNVFSNSTGTLPGAGDAGSVTIDASGSFTSNGSKVSTSAENAKGGDILIDAQNVQLSNGTLISASSRSPLLPKGAGNAGNITINSDSNVVMQNSSVTTEASEASGGNIEIDASDAGMIQLVNSKVSTSVGGLAGEPGASDGGNINIDPAFVVLQNSQVIAQAFAGAGGAINIIATSAFIADPASIVNASSTKGISGTVNIQSPLQNVGGELTALTQEFSSAAALLAQQCAARAAGGTFSTFVVSAREGLPVEPGGFLASPSWVTGTVSGTISATEMVPDTLSLPKYDARPIQLAKLGGACHRQ